jgi:aldose 1-epimerase
LDANGIDFQYRRDKDITMSLLGRSAQFRFSGLLNEPSACTLKAGDFQAVFLPGHGMLGASLRHKGVEILRRIENLDAAAAGGSTAGIPLLYPWANRLNGPRYSAAGREVNLELSSRLLHLDANGLPMHGVPWSLLTWEVTDARKDFIAAQLDWSRDDLLAVFPFRHNLQMTAALGADGLAIETTLAAGPDGPVPVSFGFHPYVGLAGTPRQNWRLELPPMRKLLIDSRGIPNGSDESFPISKLELGERGFDDGFALMNEQASFSIAGGDRRITLDFVAGYRYSQIYAPKDKDYIAIEPMTAPTSALASGQGLRLVEPGGKFQAVFRIRIEE